MVYDACVRWWLHTICCLLFAQQHITSSKDHCQTPVSVIARHLTSLVPRPWQGLGTRLPLNNWFLLCFKHASNFWEAQRICMYTHYSLYEGSYVIRIRNCRCFFVNIYPQRDCVSVCTLQDIFVVEDNCIIALILSNFPILSTICAYHIHSHHCHHCSLECHHRAQTSEYTDHCCTEMLHSDRKLYKVK